MVLTLSVGCCHCILFVRFSQDLQSTMQGIQCNASASNGGILPALRDVVFTGIMPNEDGFELLKQLHEQYSINDNDKSNRVVSFIGTI